MLEALPLTGSGKVDRRALPAPGSGRPRAGGRLRGAAHLGRAGVADVWREVLGREKVGVHDNFFEVGGSSLLLVRIHARLREVLGREITMVQLFRNPTVQSSPASWKTQARESRALAEAEDRAQRRAGAVQQIRRGRPPAPVPRRAAPPQGSRPEAPVMSRSRVRRATLPNGLEIAYQAKAEMEQMYDDIFEKRVYTRQGITLRDGDTVFDVGGNIGLFTVFVALHWPAARIWTFEPAPPLFQILSANTAPYGERIRLFNCGLSSRPGEAELTFYPHTSGMSSFYPNEQEEARGPAHPAPQRDGASRKEVEELRLQYEDELLERALPPRDPGLPPAHPRRGHPGGGGDPDRPPQDRRREE